jgi:ferric-dicitrate binding protein FerR (iron transport regulator)
MSSRLNYLWKKYLAKTCTDAEKQELANIVLDSKYEEEIRLFLEQSWNELEPSNDLPAHRSDAVLHSILQSAEIQTAEEAKPTAKIRHLFAWRFAAVTASVLLIVGAGIYFLFNKNLNGAQNKTALSFAKVQQDVKAPEVSRAMIVLENGKTVLLDSLNKENLSLQGSVSVAKTQDGQIIYKGASNEMVYNTLVNPRGSKVVNLTLQDGTKVWLNCESSLKYPIAFGGKERMVEIRGEAYFEVAKDPSKKFIVLANGVKTEVFGTHFNVNSYNDLGHTSVTLLEGSVKVSNKASSAFLTPGQQAKLNEASKVNVQDDVETEEIVAWKNGLFNFNSLTLQSIMQQIERWYDVEVEYDGIRSEKHFSGIFSRSENVSEVLKMMQLAGIKFKIDGKKIIVTE